jgi:hypothetical protein
VEPSGRAVSLVLPVLLLVAVAIALLGCGGADPVTSEAASTTTTEFVLPISDDSCLSCHEDFLAGRAGEDHKVFSHALHSQQRIMCSRCHTGVGHGGAPLPDQKVCDDCHGVRMPHPAGYGTVHGEQVRAAGSDQVCRTCHNVYLHCQRCHGVQMPHPEQWVEKHGSIAYPQMQTCSTCHAPSYCLNCHPVVMPHPQDWTRTHGLPVLEQGSVMCASCHSPTLCESCHGMQMPHPSDWGTSHKIEARDKRAECMLCHVEEDCATCHEIHQSHGKGGGV